MQSIRTLSAAATEIEDKKQLTCCNPFGHATCALEKNAKEMVIDGHEDRIDWHIFAGEINHSFHVNQVFHFVLSPSAVTAFAFDNAQATFDRERTNATWEMFYAHSVSLSLRWSAAFSWMAPSVVDGKSCCSSEQIEK